MKTLEYGLL